MLYLDIETIPNLTVDQTAEIAAGITAPGNYSKPETIEKWMAENKQRLVDEAVAKGGLDGATGRIICLSWAWDNEGIASASGEEPDVLQALFADVQDRHKGMAVTVCGHNISWDIRFIWQRAVVNNIKPPANIRWNGKPWDHADTMMLWNPDNQRRISLDKLCKVLGVETSKGDLDGSKVWQAFKDGRIKDIAAYCSEDVRATRECYKRMVFA